MSFDQIASDATGAAMSDLLVCLNALNAGLIRHDPSYASPPRPPEPEAIAPTWTIRNGLCEV
jgi:hypothetical protein